ncbi:hypothetical protein, partial [Mediterraneibacter gnavus]
VAFSHFHGEAVNNIGIIFFHSLLHMLSENIPGFPVTFINADTNSHQKLPKTEVLRSRKIFFEIVRSETYN